MNQQVTPILECKNLCISYFLSTGEVPVVVDFNLTVMPGESIGIVDVTVEAGIVKLIRELSEKNGSSQIYISHNLGLILGACQRVCVMYSSEIVEEATIESLFDRPKHPYVHGLFACIP